MSLRDFNSSSDDRPVILNTEPVGNGSGLGSFHTVNPEEREPNNTPKIVGALAVALMVGAGGIYFYSMTGKHPAPIQTASLPSTPAPTPQPAAMTAPVATPAETTPAVTTPTPEATPAPMRSADAKPIKTRTAREQAPVEQQAAVIPEPVSPKASPSDIAANNTQPTAVPQSTTTPTNDVAVNTPTVQAPQDIQPAPAVTAPAEQQTATPAPQPAQPAQSSGQVQQ